MKNSFGNSMTVTLFGESHGQCTGVVLDGLAPGIRVDDSFIRAQLDLRRPSGAISTARVEEDQYQIVSGVYEGFTTGTPLCIIIPNKSVNSADYSALAHVARPGHADYSAQCKYHGFQDYRGGGHFSGRLTAALVAAGALVIPALKEKGIIIGSHISSCAGISDEPFSSETGKLESQIKDMNVKSFAVISEEAGKKMREEIIKAADEGDSTGGVLETAVLGLPAGLGEPWFDSVESLLSHALFSIPSVKGVQFGAGFDLVNGRGSEFNDALRSDKGRIFTTTNNNGGINGGITNGMPVVFRCAVKPTPSIFRTQETVDFSTGENTELSLSGRHDPAIIHRARVVVDSVTALVLYDILAGRYGADWFYGRK
ncbi:MAG: chorismate synthase [Spirochaetales bacterium]|nr:chorismate synthase [Spirochaetales bacterium]